MNQSSQPGRASARESDESRGEADGAERQTPSTDMQPEDAGTPDSGNTGRGTAAEPGVKQASKTERETGSQR